MTKVREHWSSKIGFVFAAVGSAIGLGVLWKFPYTVGQNGGGLFLLAYLICVLIIGIPVFVAELMLGRSSQRAAVGAFSLYAKSRSEWKVGGWLGVIASFLIMSFYSVIAGWGMSYVLMSLTGFYQNLSDTEIRQAYLQLASSGDITVFWHFLFTVITMSIVVSGVRKGIEFWSKIMTRTLFILLVCLFLYSMTMPGFREAAVFIFYPDPERFQFSSILEALGLAFFTLSLGQGIMISYGSYMRSKENLLEMALMVAFAMIFVAILAAMTVFPVVFSFGLSPNAGSGMVFQTLPYLFAKLPGSLVLSTIFFTLFVFTALTSSIPFVEVVATNIMEMTGWTRKKAVVTTACATFLFGIPCALSQSKGLFPDWETIYGMNFMETIEEIVFVWLVPLAGLMTSLFVGWKVDKEVLYREFFSHTEYPRIIKIWHFFLKWVIPLVIFLIILQSSGLMDIDRLIHKS